MARGQWESHGRSQLEEELDAVVAELQRIERASGIGRKIAIGELILRRFFAGSVSAWRSRRAKCQSLRKIASREDCPFGKSTLHEAVGVYVVTLEIPDVQTFGHVSASHIAAVLPLPAEVQAQLLRRAEQEQWSVRRLKSEVLQHRQASDACQANAPVSRSAWPSFRSVREGLRQLLSFDRHNSDTVTALRSARAELVSLLNEIDGALATVKLAVEASRPNIG